MNATDHLHRSEARGLIVAAAQCVAVVFLLVIVAVVTALAAAQ